MRPNQFPIKSYFTYRTKKHLDPKPSKQLLSLLRLAVNKIMLEKFSCFTEVSRDSIQTIALQIYYKMTCAIIEGKTLSNLKGNKIINIFQLIILIFGKNSRDIGRIDLNLFFQFLVDRKSHCHHQSNSIIKNYNLNKLIDDKIRNEQYTDWESCQIKHMFRNIYDPLPQHYTVSSTQIEPFQQKLGVSSFLKKPGKYCHVDVKERVKNQMDTEMILKASRENQLSMIRASNGLKKKSKEQKSQSMRGTKKTKISLQCFV